MSKFRSLILIIGLLLIAVAAALLTVLVLYATDVLRTDPIELVLTIEDKQKVYDGTPLTAEEYRLTEGELLKGHTLHVEFTGSQTNAGESESDLVAKVLDEKGFDVTKEYAFKTEKGKLTVAPVEISVEIQDSEVPYNGKQIDFNDYLVTEGTLVRGHKLVAVSDTVLLEANKQLTKDDLHVLVYDLFDNPVTENYVLNFEMEGTIKVVKRPITVKPVGATKIYDGLTLTCDNYEITSELKLAPNQTAFADYYADGRDPAKLTDAGEVRIHIDGQTFRIVDENNKSVTENYEIEYDTDFLTIQKRGLILTAKSGTWVYDGKEHSYEDEKGVYLVEGLASGEEISSVTYSGKIQNVGTEKNEIKEVKFANNKKLSNYNCVYVSGTLEVTPMSITVYSKYIYKEYDGASLGDYVAELNTTLYDTVPKLPAGFKLDSENDVEDLVNAGSGVYTLKNIAVKNSSNNDDCTDNFVISVVSGQYTIDKKAVQFKLKEISKTYTAAPQTVSAEEAFENVQLPDGLTVDDFDLVCAEEGYKNVGTYSYSAKIKDDEEAKNYALTVSPGSLTIKKYKVSIELAELGSKPYDGTMATLDAGSVFMIEPDDTVLQKAFAEISTYSYEVTPTEDYLAQQVKVTAVTISANGEDITGNLDIDYSAAKTEVTLEKREFTVVVLDAVTNNVAMLYYEISKYITAPSLVAGDRLEIPEGSAYAMNGYIYVEVTNYRIFNAAGFDVTDLYDYVGDSLVSGHYVVTT
ncbi:MAG: hypothetical protein K2K38_01630 [Clostridia bacterium]|nr:hypothetical protein [Clostridia bacterium]